MSTQNDPDEIPPPMPPEGEPTAEGDEIPPPGPPPTWQSVRIDHVSPIGGATAGGITVTLTGRGFQSNAAVYFGNSPSPEVMVDSSTSVRAVLPATPQPSSVNVSLVNPDGSSATLAGGFTYVSTAPGQHAEILGIEPLAVIEDTVSEITLIGRNLIDAYTNGMLAARYPSRAGITVLNFTSRRDAATGIESLTFTTRITASPPLAPSERMVIQVLASRRAAAASDGIVDSSRQMFTVLPRVTPVTLAYTASIDPSRPNLIVVVGRNLEGCTFDLGGDATVHLQRSEDDLLAGIVSFPDGLADSASPQLFVRDADGVEVAQYSMSVSSDGDAVTAGTPPQSGVMTGISAEADAGGIGLSITPVPGQQLVAPTADDSAVFNLSGVTPSSSAFDWSNFVFTIISQTFTLRIANFVRLVPFFDGGGTEEPSNSPVLAQVGRLFRLRGFGLLLALRIDVTISIDVMLIIGFRSTILDLFNEFGQSFPWAVGSIVIGFRIVIEIEINIHFLIALVLPGNHLKVLEVFDLDVVIDFTISDDNRHLHFGANFTYKVNRGGIGPLNNLFPCDGKFQLADENGQTVFTDAFGGQQSFYFPRAAGRCCLPWNFDLELIRFRDGEPETTVQHGFGAELCLNAAPSQDISDIIVTSEHPAPQPGLPRHLVMEINDDAALKALAQPVDAAGTPTGPLQDVRDLGYNVEFYLEPLRATVLDPTLLPRGEGLALLPGDNVIHARVFVRTGETPQFSFLPNSVLGFSIASFLARGLLPAIQAGGLPVTVNPAPSPITIEPTVVYKDAQDQLVSVTELERFEPFETPRVYTLAAKINVPDGTPLPQTLTFTVESAKMSLSTGGSEPLKIPKDPIPDGLIFPADRSKAQKPLLFFTGNLARETQQATLTINTKPDPNKWIEIPGLTVIPNQAEDAALTKLIPPGEAVGNRKVQLIVKLKAVSSNANVTVPHPELTLSVLNDENFEEYLRVFREVQTIMSGTDATSAELRDFAKNLYADLTTTAPAAHTDLLKTKGQRLWTLANTLVQTVKKDDRLLYWARLQSIAALRTYYRRNNLTLTPETIAKFERPSRGLDPDDGGIHFPPEAANIRKAIVTGFDTFGLLGSTAVIDRSNPSGLIALEVNGQPFGPPEAPVYVRTAILPVRYDDFDHGIVEVAVGKGIDLGAVIVITCSDNSGRDFYDVERWAGKMRGNLIPDNVYNFMPSTPQNPLVTDPGILSPKARHFLESTLPYTRVIMADPATQVLLGPKGDSTTHQTPFVVDQSYRILSTSAPPNTVTPGENRPSPQPSDPPSLKQAWFVKQPDEPRDEPSFVGSGSNYLSNEIFYRTALTRNSRNTDFPSGHLHVPSTGNDPLQNGPRLLEGFKNALGRFLRALPRLRSSAGINFPQTPVNTTSAPVTLTAFNETSQAVQIARIDVSQPFAAQLPSSLPIPLNPSATLSLPITFRPTAAGVFNGVVRLLAAPASATTPSADETVWVDDFLPAGATPAGNSEDWNWVGIVPAPFSGVATHLSNLAEGLHQHFFTNATQTLAIGVGDTLFAYVYLDPDNPPSEVMLQWFDGSWEHRAFWGSNFIPTGAGSTVVNSRSFMGVLPPTGKWVRLEVPARLMGLEGRTVSGMAFTLFGGRAVWDRAGTIKGLPPTDVVWVDDYLPTGTTTDGVNEDWKWVNNFPRPFSGLFAWQSENYWGGMHRQRFYGASPGFAVSSGETLFAHIYIDPIFPAAEVMLEWYDGSWEHRAYWGTNEIDQGVVGTNSRRYMGTLPAAGKWVRLEVPASSVGVEGRTISGMAFTLYNGRATWDRVGKTSLPTTTETVWVEDSLPAGATPAGDGEGWNFVGTVPAPFSGTASHLSNNVVGFHQHFFSGATQTLDVGAGDTLFAYVYLDPQSMPSEVMLQWNDGTWEHRAFWGANQINVGTDGTPSRRFMGPLPAAGQWARLEVPASLVGLEGHTLNGMAFSLFGGRAVWDRSGKVSSEILLTATLTGEGV